MNLETKIFTCLMIISIIAGSCARTGNQCSNKLVNFKYARNWNTSILYTAKLIGISLVLTWLLLQLIEVGLKDFFMSLSEILDP